MLWFFQQPLYHISRKYSTLFYVLKYSIYVLKNQFISNHTNIPQNAPNYHVRNSRKDSIEILGVRSASHVTKKIIAAFDIFVLLPDEHRSLSTPENWNTVFENYRKSLIQHCKLRSQFEWTKVEYKS